jgi:hypothetical protein
MTTTPEPVTEDGLIRPITGIENRMPLEVFDMMCARIRAVSNTTSSYRDFIEQIACCCIPGLPEEAIRDAQTLLGNDAALNTEPARSGEVERKIIDAIEAQFDIHAMEPEDWAEMHNAIRAALSTEARDDV